jgi:hypothetical protein
MGGWRHRGCGAPPSLRRTTVRPSAIYVTPSRRATRTALSNSSSARAYHLDVATLRRFSPAAAAAAAAASHLPPPPPPPSPFSVNPSPPPASPPRPARFALSRLSSVPSHSLPAGSPPQLHRCRTAPLHVAGLRLHRSISLSLGLGVCPDLMQPARACPRRLPPQPS